MQEGEELALLAALPISNRVIHNACAIIFVMYSGIQCTMHIAQ